jgi:hypothetical protein
MWLKVLLVVAVILLVKFARMIRESGRSMFLEEIVAGARLRADPVEGN